MLLKWPKVTVVMSTYNRPERLKKAVQCVLDQDFTDYELLVVDDGSDSAHTALEDFAEKFDSKGVRFGVIGLEENSGYQAVPKNIGIAYSRGSYIAHADDDDEWYPWHLSTLVEEIEKGGCDLVYGSWDFGGDREGESWEHIPFNHLTAKLAFSEPANGFISCHTLYSKAAAIVALGPKPWNEELRRFGDWELYRSMWMKGMRFRGVNRATYKYMWHGENLQLTRPANELSVKVTGGGESVKWDHKEVK